MDNYKLSDVKKFLDDNNSSWIIKTEMTKDDNGLECIKLFRFDGDYQIPVATIKENTEIVTSYGMHVSSSEIECDGEPTLRDYIRELLINIKLGLAEQADDLLTSIDFINDIINKNDIKNSIVSTCGGREFDWLLGGLSNGIRKRDFRRSLYFKKCLRW